MSQNNNSHNTDILVLSPRVANMAVQWKKIRTFSRNPKKATVWASSNNMDACRIARAPNCERGKTSGVIWFHSHLLIVKGDFSWREYEILPEFLRYQLKK